MFNIIIKKLIIIIALCKKTYPKLKNLKKERYYSQVV